MTKRVFGATLKSLIIVCRDKTAKHIRKAEHNFKAISAFAQIGFPDWSVSAAFYTKYHRFLAILAKYGYESRNPDCTLAVHESLIEEGKIGKDFQRYVDAISPDMGEDKVIPMREKYQYTPIVDIDKQKVEELLGLCQDMIKDTKGIVQD